MGVQGRPRPPPGSIRGLLGPSSGKAGKHWEKPMAQNLLPSQGCTGLHVCAYGGHVLCLCSFILELILLLTIHCIKPAFKTWKMRSLHPPPPPLPQSAPL